MQVVKRIKFLLSAALFISAVHAQADSRPIKLREINFDMWCQEHRHLPPSRCDKRLPKDNAAFEAYVNTIEHYETQRLDNEADDRRINRTIEADPVDTPTQSAPNANRQPW